VFQATGWWGATSPFYDGGAGFYSVWVKSAGGEGRISLRVERKNKAGDALVDDLVKEFIISSSDTSWKKLSVEIPKAGEALGETIFHIIRNSGKGVIYLDNMEFIMPQYVTRAVFVYDLARILEIDTSGNYTSSFKDVADDSLYASAIAWAVGEGIVSGAGNGLFSPNAVLTKQEMAVVALNFSRSYGMALPKRNDPVVFSDQDAIAPWAAEAVSLAQQSGIVSGKDGAFEPESVMTRTEAAIILDKLLETLRN
jgi:hypothetical protein